MGCAIRLSHGKRDGATETYFGQYLGQWLADKGLLTTERCASGEGIFAYANGVQRTIATGRAIVAGAFAGL